MTVITRDAWSDAHQAATVDDLDPGLAAVRRRLWLRGALSLALQVLALLAAFFLIERLIDPSAGDLWRVPLHVVWGGFGLTGVGVVLMIVGYVRTAGKGRRFIDPDAFLPRADRRWLRTQVAQNRPVPDERRAVVADAARRMVVEGRFVPAYAGLTLFFVGMTISAPLPTVLIEYSAVIVVMLVHAVRGAVWSRRAGRWLALND